jgi:hypothetical protein
MLIGHGSPGAHAAPSAAHGAAIQLTYVGQVSYPTGSLASGTGTFSKATELASQPNEQDAKQSPADSSVPASAALTVGSSSPKSVSVGSSTASGFPGLDHFDSRYAANGNQFSLEPPDQGLCANSSYVVENVNDVFAVYDAGTHTMVGKPVSLNQFFGLAPSINRTTGVRGPEATDPKCYFDASTNRWFVSMLELDQNPTGGLTGASHEYLAVSQNGSPNNKYTIYSFDSTNPNGLSDCPCFGDQPLIGADANGVYISTNEFSTLGSGFNGAQLYGFSKSALESTTQNLTGFHMNLGALPAPSQTITIKKNKTTTLPGGPWYSVQPAITAPGSSYESANGGTEYFLSSLDFSGFGDNRIATWALTNTSALNSDPTQVAISDTVIGSETYSNTPSNGTPFAAAQKAGPTPFADYLNTNNNNECGAPCGPQGLAALNANDDRMNQVVYAGGLLYSGLNSTTTDNRVQVAYFVVSPSDPSGTLSASMTNQGYVQIAGDNVLFPSIGVNAQGQGVIAFTVAGPDYYPSAAYAPLSATAGAGNVTIIGAGVGPEDGFTGYPFAQYDPGVSRWGDYSASVASPDGSIWSSNEYIGQTCSDAQFAADFTCGSTRSELANWGTFVYQVHP